MTDEGMPLQVTLAFASGPTFDQAYERALGEQRLFVPHGRPLAAGAPVEVAILLPGLEPLSLQGEVEFFESDSEGRSGLLLRLSEDALGRLTRFHQASLTARATLAPSVSDTALRPAASPPEAPPPGPPRDSQLEPGALLDNRFLIEAHLASGGMGDVYRATHVFLKRPIALKLLKRSLAADPDMWARFQREAELVSQLESPHVVRTFDFGTTAAGQPFLAMEYVQGVTLEALLGQERALPPERAVRLLREVCDGLSEAHALGITHRDLKPSNIIVGKRRDGTELAKILDFGIARIADLESSSKASLTQLGMVVGTPAYLAPEQALADQVDHRTDIYALGCVAFELLSGRPPFLHDSVQKLVSAHVHEAPPLLSAVAPALQAMPALSLVVARALEKNRADRYPTVRALSEALAAALGPQLPAGARRTGAIPRVDRAPTEALASWPPVSAVTTPAPPPPAPPPIEDWGPDTSAPADRPLAAAAPEQPPPAEVADFFAATDRGTSPTAAVADTPTRRALVALGPSIAPAVLQGLLRPFGSEGAQGTVLHLEVLRAQGPVRAALLARALTAAHHQAAVLHELDDDGATLLFPGPSPFASSARAGLAALGAQEGLSPQGGPTVRAALCFGKLGPSLGSLVARARALVARAPPGALVAEKAAVTDCGDLLALADFPQLGSEVAVLTGRRWLLRPGPGALVGREVVLSALDARLASLGTLKGVAQSLVCVGESGLGRTAIATELSRRARAVGALVAFARGLPSLRGQPWSALAELFCNVCEVPKWQRAARLGSALEALKLPPAELEAARVVAGLSFVPQPFTPGQAAAALRAVLAAAVPARKVVLIFDALETVDPHSLDAFLKLASDPVPRVLVVGLCAGARAKESLAGLPQFELHPFKAPQVAQWLSAQLAPARAGEKLSGALLQASAGVPGTLVDLALLAQERGLLRVKDGVALLEVSEAQALADAAPHHAQERLEGLAPLQRALFEAVACAGDSIDSGTLKALLPSATPESVGALLASGLVQPVSQDRCAISRPVYREAALALPYPARADLHQRLAVQLVERSRAAGLAPDPALVAHHLSLSGDVVRALQLYRQCVETALSRKNPREALHGLVGWSQALAELMLLPTTPAEAARARVETLARAAANAITIGEAAWARGLVDEALQVAQAAAVESGELQLSLARVLRSEARRSKATAALKLAASLSGNTALGALCLLERGEALEAEGDLVGAAAALTRALELAEPAQDFARWHGEIDLRARLETRLGAVLLARKEPAAALETWGRALASWRRTGWPYAEARVLANLGALRAQAGEHEEAAAAFKEAAAAAGRCGDLLFQARQLLSLARVASKAQSLFAARQAAEGVKRLSAAVGWDEGLRQVAALRL